jgi:hypothetical protein
MDEMLEAAILGDANDDDIEEAILIMLNPLRNNCVDPERQQFDLNEISFDQAKLNFRFEKNDIPILAELLGLPEQIITSTRNNVDRTTALCILLRRLAYPNRLKDLTLLFGLSPQSLSQIINTTTNIIMENKGNLLENLQANQWLDRNRLQYYAQVVGNRGGAVHNCWGFIDGTARPICRPSVQQENYYSGHKRFHCLKYQSVLCPDGIIVNLKGAYQGRRHDAGIFRESQLYNELERAAVFPDNERYVLYGDQAYGVMELLLCLYLGRPQDLPAYQVEFNRSMKILIVAVEWGFQKIVSQFAFLDLKKNLKLLLQDVESLYKVGVLLTVTHVCMKVKLLNILV